MKSSSNLFQIVTDFKKNGIQRVGVEQHCIQQQVLLSVAPEVIKYRYWKHKLNTSVTHTLCVVRKYEQSPFVILPPCGVCQERLYYWGEDVKAAVSVDEGEIVFKTLQELQPYYWHSYHF